MNTPVIIDVTIYRGTAPTLRFTATANGAVTGTFKFTMRELGDSPDPVSLEATGTITTVGDVSTPGVVTGPLTKVQTLALEERIYAASLERTSSPETVFAIGRVRVKYDVRNPAA